MKIALVVTTINVPNVLALYRRYALDFSGEVAIFVAGDHKTPTECAPFCLGIDATYLSPDAQIACNYACSDHLGWNTDARRNIAVLEALKWGADIFVYLDDDNFPLNADFFPDLYFAFEPFSGLELDGDPWVNANAFLLPGALQRGIPPDKQHIVKTVPTIDRPVGVAQATILGDPDLNAHDRLNFPQPTWSASDVLRSGFVVDPRTSRTAFNTQATGCIRMFTPAMFIWPHSGTDIGVGRNADIYASLITQRIMRETNHVVHFGKPFVLQQRNPHNLLRDLKSELFAMEHIEEFAQWLDGTKFPPGAPVINNVRALYFAMREEFPWLPAGVSEAGIAWCDDVAKVLPIPEPPPIMRGPNYEELSRITREAFKRK